MIKILLLGDRGFLGSEFKFYLNKKKIKIFTLKEKKVTLTVLKKNFSKFKPNFIINCIAKTNAIYCNNNQQKAFESNFKIPSMILKVIRNSCVKFIHFSSEAVFDKKNANIIKIETDLPKPQSIYGITKYAADKLIIKSKNTLIIRLPFIYSISNNKNIILRILNKLSKKESVRVSNSYFSTFASAHDICNFTYNKCIRRNIYFKKKLIHFTISKKMMSVFDLVKKLAKLNKKINIKRIIPTNEAYFIGGMKRAALNSKNIKIQRGLSSIYSETGK
jgi:dTDP-4-dehydrorhamnose reductase